MISRLLFLGFFLVGFESISLGQSLAFADSQFENFEFKDALLCYQKLRSEDKLDFDHAQKMAYCMYVIGDTNGITFIDSLLQKNSNLDHLWMWKATLEKDKGDYISAIESFNKFQEINKDFDVSFLIESCRQIPDWSPIQRSEVSNVLGNDKYANSFYLAGGEVYLFENGISSEGVSFGRASTSETFAEMLLMKPYLKKDSLFEEMKIEGFEKFTISSISMSSGSKEVFFDGTNLFESSPKSRIYSGKLFNGQISDVEEINLNVSELEGSYFNPAVDNSGSKMIFSAITSNQETSDLYITNRVNGSWSPPSPLSQLNSKGNELHPKIIGDSLLIFSSDGKIGYGGLDVYYVKLSELDDPAAVNHYKYPINSTMDDFNLSWIDSLNATLVSNRYGGKGDDDLWKLTIEPLVIEEIVEDDGFDEWFEKWKFSKIYFAFDSSITSIHPLLIDGLQKYGTKYNLSLDLVGHTDARGSVMYNQELGLNRANFVAEKFNEKVGALSMKVSSVGESKLVNDCQNDKKCSDEEHLENRFVTVEIQKP